LGPGGINFGFMKDFWEELKDDYMCFISEFHCNGMLSKGIKNILISLIPKVESPRWLSEFKHISFISSKYKLLVKVYVIDCVASLEASS